MKIVLEPENEIQATWLQLMLESEIDDTKGIISNEYEQMAKEGCSPSGELARMHKENIRDLLGYLDLLEDALTTLTKKGDTK